MTLREAHKLYKPRGNARPTNVFFVDTETTLKQVSKTRTNHKLRLGHVFYTRTRRSEYLRLQSELAFTSHKQFWDFLFSKIREKSNYHVITHNLSYDMPVLRVFSTLPKNGFILQSFYSKGLVSIIKFIKYFPKNDSQQLWLDTNGDKGSKPIASRLIFIDNSNFFPGKLAKWGELIDLPKLSVDLLGKHEQLAIYCRRDTEILHKLWLRWYAYLDKIKCPTFSNTLAGTAFNTFRAVHNKHDIWIHSDADTLKLERESYKGGRVECLFSGFKDDERVFLLDINSMYPALMKKYKYPVSLYPEKPYKNIKYLDKLLNDYAVIAKVTLNTNEPAFPVKHEGRYIYPVGTFTTTLSTPELKYALEHDMILEVHAMRHYRQHHIFTSYVDYFYKQRLQYEQQNDKLSSQQCKLLLNSLYGKFGQTGLDDKYVGACPPDSYSIESYHDADDGSKGELIHVAGSIILRTYTNEGYNSFVAIASHVTAYGRMYLYSLLKIAGRANVLYMDTDSLLVTESGYDTLRGYINPTELGALKLERTSRWVQINAPKDYAMTSRHKLKGVKKDAHLIAPNTYSQVRWPKLQGMIRSGDINDYATYQQTKTLKRKVQSGVHLASGLIVPHVVGVTVQLNQDE